MSSVGNEIKKLGLMSMYHFLETDPEKHLPELLDWLDTCQCAGGQQGEGEPVPVRL